MSSSHKPATEPAVPKAPADSEQAPVQPIDAREVTQEAQLQDEINRLTEEMGRIRDQWVRAVAEAENIRKRAQREQEDTARYATTAFASDMVSVLENLMRASENIPPQQRGENELLKTLGAGVDLTLQELLNTFQKYGIHRIDPMGKKFDHNFHQAVAQLERDDVPPGTVVQVVQAGYIIHDRLLRPAMVAVSKPGEPPQKVDTTA